MLFGAIQHVHRKQTLVIWDDATFSQWLKTYGNFHRLLPPCNFILSIEANIIEKKREEEEKKIRRMMRSKNRPAN